MLIKQLLQKCKAQGINLSLDGDNLQVHFDDTPSSEFLALLKVNKNEITNYLREHTVKGGGLIASIPVSTFTDKVDLSWQQNALYFIGELHNDNSQYNMIKAYGYQGYFDVDVASRALTQIIERHPILNIQIERQKGIARQWVNSEIQLVLNEHQLSDLPADEQDEQIKQVWKQEQNHHFFFDGEPLIRITHIIEGKSKGIVIFNLHHVVADGASVAILIKEFITIYESLKINVTAHLTPLSVQYFDYVKWQQSDQQQQSIKAQQDYWQQMLADAPSLHQLNTDFPRKAVKSNEGAILNMVLDNGLEHRISQYCQQHAVTPFILLQTVLAALVGRYSNSTDVLIGTPVAGREHPQLEPLIGLFINTLTIRSDLAGDPSFVDLLARNKKQIIDAMANQLVPFERVVETLNQSRSLSYSPVFQIFFSVESKDIGSIELPELTLSPLDFAEETSKFDLELMIKQSTLGMSLCWRYDPNLFAEDTIASMAEHYKTLLVKVLADSSIRIGQIDLLSRDQRRQQLDLQPANVKPKGGLVHQQFEQQVELHSEKVAVIDSEREVSYRQLNQMANKVAHYLRNIGVKPDTLVGLFMGRTINSIVGLLGILKAGAGYLSLDQTLPAKRINYIACDSNIKLVLTDDDQPFEQADCHSLSVERILAEAGSIDNLDCTVNENNLAYVIYTSGSTGQPKGVMVEHTNVVSLLNSCAGHYQYDHTDRWSAFHSTSFDFSVWEMFGALTTGASLCLVPKQLTKDTIGFAQWVVEQQITLLSQTPSVFYSVADALMKQALPHQIRYVVLGGEAFDKAKLNDWFNSSISDDVSLVNMYGITETTVHVTMELISKDSSPDSIGMPLDGYKVFVINDADQLQPANVPGELCVAGCGVVRGYLNRDTLTAERFVNLDLDGIPVQRVYKTGDLVCRRADGSLKYLGRIDQQVKVRGFRIELGEIESCLKMLPGVVATVVDKVERQSGAQLIAFVVFQADFPQDWQQQLDCGLREQLPDYMVPSLIKKVPQIPVTRNGKVDRKQLLDMLDQSDVDTISVPLSGETEHKLAKIWCKLLQLDEVGSRDNFFALGGHSLLVTRLVAAIEDEFGKSVTLQQLFKIPELAKQALQITQSNTSVQIISKIPSEARLIPSFAQERMWLACQMDGNTSKYNIPATIRLSGELNVQAVKQALNAIVNRHQALRMKFVRNTDDSLKVEINKSSQVQLLEHDLSAMDEAKKADALEQLKQREGTDNFDLAEDLMLRARLVILAPQTHMLLVTLHHIAADGWSIKLLLNEFVYCYNGACQGIITDLPKLDIQYVDFAYWQKEVLDQSSFDSDMAFWQQKLTGLPAIHGLTLDNPRPATMTSDSGLFLQTINHQQTEALNQLALGQQCSLFTVVQSIFALLLAINSNENDIVMACPMAGREMSQLQGLIGLFTNNLVFRTQLDSQMGFDELLAQSRQWLLEGSNHQKLPYEMLVSEFTGQRQGNFSPLCQIALNFINESLTPPAMVNLQWQDESDEYSIADLDLHLTVRQTESGMTIRWLYNKTIFHCQTVEKWMTQWSELSAIVIRQPNIKLSDISLASTNCYQALNDTADIHIPKGLAHQLVEQSAVRDPQATAVVYGDDSLNYQELNVEANQVAHYLISKGVKPDQRVGICLQRSMSFVVAMLGVLKTGASYVPLDPEHPEEHLAYIVKDAGINIIVTEQDLNQKFDFIGECIMVLMDQQLRQILLGTQPKSNPELDFASSEQLTAYNIYTSGTTGMPKGVAVKHSALVNLMHHESSVFKLNTQSRVIHAFSIGFDPATGHLFSTLNAGASVHICPLRADIVEFIEKYKLTHLSVPTALLSMLKPQSYEHLQLISVGGEQCPAQLARDWGQYCRFINLYGPTEATVYALYNEYNQTSPISLGRPVRNSQCYIVNKLGQLAAIDQQGELVVAGASIATEYINQPELNLQAYPQIQTPTGLTRVYRTGDLVVMDEANVIQFVGRIDNQLKIRGYRVEPGQIEQRLLSLPAVKTAVVVACDTPTGIKALVAYYTESPLHSSSATTIKAAISEMLPSYSVPSYFVSMDELPLTINGKVDLGALPTPQNEAVVFVEPVTVLEIQVAKIWGKVLKIERVSMTVDFFDVGGNSLLAMMLVSQIKEQFGINIQIKDIFQCQTPSELVLWLNEVIEQFDETEEQVEIQW